MKIGLRILLGFFLIVGLTAALSLRLVLDEIKPLARETSEATLIETAYALASVVAPTLAHGGKVDGELASQLRQYTAQIPHASIWHDPKNSLDMRLYITDAKGIVLFDSDNCCLGMDYSRWNDVWLTLHGRYGVRTTRSDPDDEFSSTMYVAAPIHWQQQLIGVLTVAQPNRSTEPYIQRVVTKLRNYGLLLLLISLIIGLGFTAWLIISLRRVGHYAERVVAEPSLPPPHFARGTELERLTQALATMREQLDGKTYVENYVHALTHELKSPLAALKASAELLHDQQMPKATQERFLQSMDQQCVRLQQLIDRVLELARLEQRRTPLNFQEIAVHDLCTSLHDELASLLTQRKLLWQQQGEAFISADGFLLHQALRNILDNAIAYAQEGSALSIVIEQHGETVHISIGNIGPLIPDYALTKITERFYSLPRPDGSKSTGLGLSFVAEIVRRHDAKLRIGNNDKGVIVSLYFPAGAGLQN